MDTFSALADPVRRAILEALNEGPLTAGQLADRFPISRPAVSRHLKVLRQAGLVSVAPSGREREYRVEPGPLAEIETWLAQYHDTWSSRLDALETEVFRTRRERERNEHAQAERDVTFGSSIDKRQTHRQEKESA
ncbi:MAG: winged helix-turn-helix transcriptional regulator [Chloroflexia bacterium]|jgi:DNA-binding transcriptional ArsR family regulator|nr:winged helix-turn-helix transcriptional regulator [Chloroflexia bacterium]